jgi:hypothetical protein
VASSQLFYDEGTSRINITRSSACSENIAVEYKITQLSFNGSFTDRGFLYQDNILTPSETLLQLHLTGCGERCIPEGETFDLRVDWLITSPSGTISPGSTMVSFRGDW